MWSTIVFRTLALLFAAGQFHAPISPQCSEVCLDLTSSDAPIVSGREVEITFKLTNQSHETINTSSDWSHSVDGSYDYDVFDQTRNQKAKRIIHNDFIVSSSTITSALAPGHASKETVGLNYVYDLSVPGTYQAQVSRTITLNGKDVIVKSNVITITILPPPKPPA